MVNGKWFMVNPCLPSSELSRLFDELVTFQLGDLKDANGKINFYNAIIDGTEHEPRMQEDSYPPEVVEGIKKQRSLWKEFRRATQANVDVIKTALEKHSDSI